MSNVNGFGASENGLFQKLEMLKIIGDNIANASTIGYKRRIPESATFKEILGDAVLTDNRTGALKKTNSHFDLAIEGNAEFLIETKEGLKHTRNGQFHLNEKGKLVTITGDEVVIVEQSDKLKDLVTAKEKDIKINQIGEIFIGTERLGRIAMKLEDSNPVKVHQGFVETSNINLVNEMITLSQVYRSVEASEKTFGMESSVDKELIEKYGRNV